MVAALTPDYVTTFTTPGSPPYTVTIPGSTHALGQTYLFVQAYDNANPAQVIEIGSLSVNTSTRDVSVTFGAPQTGTLVLAVGSPRYVQSFTTSGTPPSVTIPGGTHGLASADLLWQVYDTSAAPALIQPGGVSVHPGPGPNSFDVAFTFAAPQSGTLLLAPVPSVAPPTLLAVLPMARTVPAPLIATRTVVEPRLGTQLEQAIEALTARLATLEAAYQTLLAQHNGHTTEESPR